MLSLSLSAHHNCTVPVQAPVYTVLYSLSPIFITHPAEPAEEDSAFAHPRAAGLRPLLTAAIGGRHNLKLSA